MYAQYHRSLEKTLDFLLLLYLFKSLFIFPLFFTAVVLFWSHKDVLVTRLLHQAFVEDWTSVLFVTFTP